MAKKPRATKDVGKPKPVAGPPPEREEALAVRHALSMARALKPDWLRSACSTCVHRAKRDAREKT